MLVNSCRAWSEWLEQLVSGRKFFLSERFATLCWVCCLLQGVCRWLAGSLANDFFHSGGVLIILKYSADDTCSSVCRGCIKVHAVISWMSWGHLELFANLLQMLVRVPTEQNYCHCLCRSLSCSEWWNACNCFCWICVCLPWAVCQMACVCLSCLEGRGTLEYLLNTFWLSRALCQSMEVLRQRLVEIPATSMWVRVLTILTCFGPSWHDFVLSVFSASWAVGQAKEAVCQCIRLFDSVW